MRAAASGAHHTGQRAYTRTSAMTPPRSSRLRCADCVAPACSAVRRGFTEIGGDRLPKGRRVHSVPPPSRCSISSSACRRFRGDPTARRPLLPGTEWHGDGRVGAVPALLRGPEGRRRPCTALPRPAAHVRYPGDRGWRWHLSTTMRYVHHRPRREAAGALERHFTGAAAEFDQLLGEPEDLHITSHLQLLRDAGGGTRTPDTRIMIPLAETSRTEKCCKSAISLDAVILWNTPFRGRFGRTRVDSWSFQSGAHRDAVGRAG